VLFRFCATEEEARARVLELREKKQWPCYFFASDTTGEKDFEEFFTDSETVQWDRYNEIGVVRNDAAATPDLLKQFVNRIEEMRCTCEWTKESILSAFSDLLPNFSHNETGKNLDNRM